MADSEREKVATTFLAFLRKLPGEPASDKTRCSGNQVHSLISISVNAETAYISDGRKVLKIGKAMMMNRDRRSINMKGKDPWKISSIFA
jgi:hypothetical protein